MRRFFCDFDIDTEHLVQLQSDQHRHLSTVLRARVGDQVVLCNGDGFDYMGIIQSIQKNFTNIKVIKKVENLAEPTFVVDLFFGVLKSSDKIDFIIQKSVELGVARLIPFVSHNTVAKDVNNNRLQKISNEALKQCGRSNKVMVEKTIDFDQMIDRLKEYDLVLWAYENANQTDDISTVWQTVQSSVDKKIALIVGSEGGFTDSEVDTFKQKEIKPITLGKRILRAETACISLLSIVMYIAKQY